MACCFDDIQFPPPWLCFKQLYMMLTLLIDDPNTSGNYINVYLRLVIDKLKMLSDHGVPMYSVARIEMFQIHAILLWTINDFLAYANLLG